MDLSNSSIAIIGGGLGGMAAAAAWAQHGAKVDLYEQAEAFAEVGAGLQISWNGQQVLKALGVDIDALRALAGISQGTVMRDGFSGRKVARVPSPKGGPTWYLHRADLLATLVQTATKAGVRFHMGHPCLPGAVSADLIIAADGMKSIWRSEIDGPVHPSFTGHVAWRALVPNRFGFDSAELTMGPRAHLVAYPVRGGALLNLVAIEERQGWEAESWSQKGDPEEFKRRFANFRGPTRVAIQQVDAVHTWALHARPVAQNWVNGTAVLLGDAAHPTLPFMAQGACLALEDAWVLTACVSACDTLEQGLARYQMLRQPRARRVVDLAWNNGWRFHMPRPFAWGAHAVLALGAGSLARRLEWVYAYDATKAL